MDEASFSELLLGTIVHCNSFFVRQFVFRTDRRNLVDKAVRITVQVSMFFHEKTDFAVTARAGSKNQNIAL